MDIIKVDFEEFTNRSDLDTDLIKSVRGLFDVGWLAGGSVRRVLTGAEPSDFDFFFGSEEDYEKWVAQVPEGFSQTRKTEHHTQYEGFFNEEKVVLQGIYFDYFTSLDDLLNAFDFTICQFSIDTECKYIHTTPQALWDTGRSKLVVNRITYPTSTMRRLLKYTAQGYTACTGCMKSILMAPIEDPDLRLQLDIEYID